MRSDPNDPAVTHVEPFTCPHCGHHMNAVGTTRGEAGQPEVGNYCCCIACGMPLTFIDPFGDSELRLRPMTKLEADNLSAEERHELGRVQAFAREVFQPDQRRRN